MNVGENIRKYREKAGMSQKALAEAVFVDQAMICKVEKGIKLPSLPLSMAIAKALGCTMDELTASA